MTPPTNQKKCLRMDGLEYDNHSLNWKDGKWICCWCQREFAEK